jgi:hypothetical protein
MVAVSLTIGLLIQVVHGRVTEGLNDSEFQKAKENFDSVFKNLFWNNNTFGNYYCAKDDNNVIIECIGK